MCDTPRPMTHPPHPLALYRLSVQHPLAEVAFVDRVWAHYHADDPQECGPREAMLLREDFAGSCATAAAWVQSDPERQAMAVELDAPTARWADQDTTDCPRCAEDLHIIVGDVMAVAEPATDVTLALNFSTLIYHDEAALLAYLQHARACLADDGLLILDLFGVVPDNAVTTQSRRIEPDDAAVAPFDYTWEQRCYDPTSQRIDCRIHFALDDGARLDDAFVYDWRLWDLATVLRLMHAAGFARAQAWGQATDHDAPDHPGDGRFVVWDDAPADADWVCYLVGVCG